MGLEDAAVEKPRNAALLTGLVLPFFLGLVLVAAPLTVYLAAPDTGPFSRARGAAGGGAVDAGLAEGGRPDSAALSTASAKDVARGVARDTAPDSRPERCRVSPPVGSRQAYIDWMAPRTGETPDALGRKWDRAQILLKHGDLVDREVLAAFLYTPREFFARRYNYRKAYEDTAIPIGHGQTISGPRMVTMMTQGLSPRPGERVLEIGTGSGYQSALLSELCDDIWTVEIVAPLYAETDAIYRRLEARFPEYGEIRRRNADGYFGWIEGAPFQKIIVTAGIDHVPPPLLRQLAPGGVMIIPVGPPTGQTMLRIMKKRLPGGGFKFERSDLFKGRKVIFVPFTSGPGASHNLDDGSAGGD